MTRYARAKGSKASNERLPEEATPWQVMQQQMLNKDDESQESKRVPTSSTTELKKKNITVKEAVTENKLVTWASFSNENEINQNKNNTKKKKKLMKCKQESENVKTVQSKCASGCENKKKKLKTNFQTDLKIKSKSRKLGQNSNKRSLQDTDDTECNIKKQQLCTQEIDVSVNVDQSVNGHVTGGEKAGKCKKVNTELAKSIREKMHTDKKSIQIKVEPTCNKNERHFGLKTKKMYNNQGRMADSDAFTMYCNGQPVKVVHYDGFLIKEKDAEELNKLKLQLITKGVLTNERHAVLQLERRKAEKALARLRKSVCYKCRKSGHNFSQCPETGIDDTLGYCFKCGSTEHTHLACKVIRAEEYRYAHCFICKEQGHIAKQCPDNPRGLYPKGGACHLCGDVTHYIKDCPQNIEEKEKNTVTVKTLNKNLVEALDEELHSKPKTKKYAKNKVVNF